MANVRIELNRAGVRSLLRSPEMLADLERRAQRIAAAAGDGFEADAAIGPRRARSSVRTASFAAMRAEATGHRLLRSLDAGR